MFPDPNQKPAGTGNASNPSPQAEPEQSGNQLLNKQAEKYLREGGNIEDMPDAQDEAAADKTTGESSTG